MPQVRPEGIGGLQLWLNLSAREKMSRPNVEGGEVRFGVVFGDGDVVEASAGADGGVTLADLHSGNFIRHEPRDE